jgi:small GTP-binding protein
MNNPEEEEDDDDDIKVILVGEVATGKTSLINTSIGLEFKDKLESTQSSCIMQKKIIIDDQTYTINLWDTIGQEQYRSLTKIFMKGAKIVIFVYDITRKETFEQLDFWFENTKEVLGNKPILGIVGNKSDLYIKEDVKEEVAEEYAKKKGVPFRLTSAKTPKNFSDFLEELVKKYIEKMENINSTIVDGLKLDEQNESKKAKKKKCC